MGWLDTDQKIFLVAGTIVLFYVMKVLLLKHLKDLFTSVRRKVLLKKYKTTVIGEIVGAEGEERYAVMDFLVENIVRFCMRIGRRYRRQRDYYPVYSAKVKYSVEGYTYEVSANHYTADKPVTGQKVYVHYNPKNPRKMCIGGFAPEEAGAVVVGRQPLRPFAKLRVRGYKDEVVGEVVAMRTKKFGCKGLAAWLGAFVTNKDVYSSVVRYKVFETVYEIDAGDYGKDMPMMGDKVLVLYNPRDPKKACVPTWIKSQKNIEVLACDKYFVYCLYDNWKKITVPISRVEEGVKPGSYLIHWYGFYQLE